jgi:hypothetical protein
MVALVRVPFYFINLLPTSLLYISILLSCVLSSSREADHACRRHMHGDMEALLFLPPDLASPSGGGVMMGAGGVGGGGGGGGRRRGFRGVSTEGCPGLSGWPEVEEESCFS